MRAVAFLMFSVAAGLFLVSSWVQWQSARRYREATDRMHEVVNGLLAEGKAPTPGPAEWKDPHLFPEG